MFEFEIEGDKLRLNLVDPFGNGAQCVVNLEQFDGSKWNPLAYPDFYIGDTSDEIYQQVETALAEINEFIRNKYGKDSSAPTGGIDLVRYIVEKQTSLDGIELKINK